MIKLYGTPPEAEARYSPVKSIGVQTQPIQANPEYEPSLTSQVERQNLEMRMAVRRFRRLPNEFSNKAEKPAYAVALH